MALICPFCGTTNDDTATVCKVCGGILSSNSLYLRQGHKLGRYELGKVLGQGGFGITYAARDTFLTRGVAIKEFFPEGSHRIGDKVISPRNLDFALERGKFLEEARLLAQFDHPGIVRVWDAFEAHDTAYLVMEFLRGETLGKRMERPITPLEVTTIAIQISEALEAVHREGLLHRDIKPDNIFLINEVAGTVTNATANATRAVLIDFGSARGFAQGQASTHTRLVTPGYAPPEQYASQAKFGPYTDLYALGATLYHALSGKMPPAATDRLLGTTLEPLPRSVPANLRDFVERCLALEVAKRPQDVREVLGLLRGDRVAVPVMTTSSSVPAHNPSQNNPPQNNPVHHNAGPSSAPKPTPSPANSGPAHPPSALISPPGENLFKAIQFAPEGSTLRLAAGKFALPRSLELKKGLTLIGMGRDQTRITGTDEGYLIYSSAGTLRLYGLSLEHVSRKPADVLVSSSRLELDDCAIRGGLSDPSGDGGNGIVLLGGADATIKNCISEQNGSSGIFLSDNARAFLEGNQLVYNKSCGVAFFGQSSGTARRNTLAYNDLHGAVVTDDAQPILEENTFERNKECGVAFLGRSRGRAFDNTVTGNALHPIFVSKESRPSLQGNSGHVVRK